MAHRVLVAGRGDERRPMAWWFWVIRDADRVIVVDTGCPDPEMALRWEITGLRSADDLLREIGVQASDVDAVVLTHAHWDHAGGASIFANARLLIRQAELDWWRACVLEGNPESVGLREQDLAAVAGRAEPVGDSEVEPWPGIRLIPGGAHTAGALWVKVGDVALASDNVYLYENLEGPTAIGACVDADANVAAIRRMLACRHVVPGHDPAVADRYPEIAPDVFRIT